MNQHLKANTDIYHQRTRSAFMWSRVFKTPLWAINSMLPFILFDLHATPIQIAVAIALKPTVSIFSMYWSAAINKRRDLLVSNIIWAGVLGLLPFFLFPFVSNPWYYIFAFGFFMMLHRGIIPAWMEIMKLNLPEVSRERIFAYGSSFGFLGDGIFCFLFAWLIDGHFQAWRWIFPATALIAYIPIFFQYRIPIRLDDAPKLMPSASPSFSSQIVKPWKDAWELMRTRIDFRRYQIGFMLGGMGLMVMHAVLPSFFMGVLDISYKELSISIFLCKGIGFALTSQIWARWMNKVDIYRFSSLVTTMAFLFPLCLLAAQSHILWLYLAYVTYGIMQAGSELSWNLSGPLFSQEEDSSVFSSVNVLTVGLRGCIAPLLGTLLYYWTNSGVVLMAGGALCLSATACMLFFSRKRGALLPKYQ